MRPKRILYIAAACGFIAALMAIYAYTEKRDGHTFTKDECFRCHRDPYSNPKQLVRRPIIEICSPCHQSFLKLSTHPVEVRPKNVTVPADMPLNYGRLTCNTCHFVHAERKTVFGAKTYLLRRPTGDMKFFCVSCHEENIANPGHYDALGSAHIGRKFRVVDAGEGLDSVSIECIGCHDGTIGMSATYSLGAGDWSHNEGQHPIGISYADAMIAKKDLVHYSRLDKRLRLYNGKIGCGTCHDMYSTIPGKLVMSNEYSALCMGCHEK